MKKGDAHKTKNEKGDQERETVRIPTDDKKAVMAAHDQAEKDMEEDAELTAQSPNDDLDEGESARLGEEKTDII